MIREDINLRVVDHPYLHQLWSFMPLSVGEGAKNLSSELEVFTDVRHVPRKALAVCSSPLVFLHGAKNTNQFVRAFLDVKVVLDGYRVLMNFFEVVNLGDSLFDQKYQSIRCLYQRIDRGFLVDSCVGDRFRRRSRKGFASKVDQV